MENNPIKLGKLYGVGVGPGDPKLLTLRTVEVLRDVDVIFSVVGVNTKNSISGGLVDSVSGCTGERVPLMFSMAKKMSDREVCWQENADLIIEKLKQGKSCAFVTIGDPLLFSTYTYVLRKITAKLKKLTVETVPGITSFQAVAASQNKAMVEDKQILAVVPAWTSEVVTDQILEAADTAVFLKTYQHKDAILESLKRNNMDADIVYAERMGLSEQMITDDISEIQARDNEYLSLMIARKNSKS